METEYNPRQILEDNGFQTAYTEGVAYAVSPDGHKFVLRGTYEKECFIHLALHLAKLYTLKGITYLYCGETAILVEDHEVAYFTEKYGWQRKEYGQ
jgi:hypothetical protein